MFDDPALKKAKSTADKCGLFEARDPKWIQRPHLNRGSLSACHVASLADRPLVEQLVDACTASQHHNRYGILFVLTYAFLLRMPSEALPITAGGRARADCADRAQRWCSLWQAERTYQRVVRLMCLFLACLVVVVAPAPSRGNTAAGLLV